MRTAAEMLEYIDSLVIAMLQRPKMFASSPESFEEQLMTLDILRGFLTSDAGSDGPAESGYVRYLREHGYEAMTYTAASHGREPLTKEDLERFENVSTFFREYRAAAGGRGNAPSAPESAT